MKGSQFCWISTLAEHVGLSKRPPWLGTGTSLTSDRKNSRYAERLLDPFGRLGLYDD